MCPQQASVRASDAWLPYEPSDRAPWDLARVVHLHRRAGFAAPWEVIQRDLADGLQASVDRVLRNDSAGDGASAFEAMAGTIGDAATASGNAARLKAWWLYRMLLSPDPLGERLTLMWHNHFATSNRKVQDLVAMREQNELFRRYGPRPFGELLAAVVKHPAMLAWLDADANRKGHPNENLARELMELFTIGVGNYTESDVKEAARSLTGWTIVGNRCEFHANRHDDGEKLVLERRGRFTPDDIIAMLLEHPATADRLAWRICHTLLGEGVFDERALAELADGLRARELNVGWAVETVVCSRLFFSEDNLHARVLGPVEYIVGALRALELADPPPSTMLLAEWTSRTGQDLFYPPNVGGWHEDRAWLTSRTIIARANFAAALVEGRLWHPALVPAVEELASLHGVAGGLHEQVSWFARLLWGDAPSRSVQEVVEAVVSSAPERTLSSAVALLLARPEHHLA